MILTILFVVFMALAITGFWPGGPLSSYGWIFLWLSVAILGFRLFGGRI